MKTWFVTGASRGLGLETARYLLACGHNVVATAREPAKIIAELGDKNERLVVAKLDVTNAGDAAVAVGRAIATFGKIDVLVNNAGYGQLGWFEDATDAQIRRQFEINVFGTFNVTRAVLPFLRAQRAGHIFVVSSTAGFNGVEGSSLYASSKFALEGWSQGLSQELSPLGIRVTIVGPGGFRTDFLDQTSVSYAVPTVKDYLAPAEAFRNRLDAYNHRQGGDPKKFGAVLEALADMANPPGRFAAGSDALSGFYRKLDQYRTDAGAFSALSESTDFPQGD